MNEEQFKKLVDQLSDVLPDYEEGYHDEVINEAYVNGQLYYLEVEYKVKSKGSFSHLPWDHTYEAWVDELHVKLQDEDENRIRFTPEQLQYLKRFYDALYICELI